MDIWSNSGWVFDAAGDVLMVVWKLLLYTILGEVFGNDGECIGYTGVLPMNIVPPVLTDRLPGSDVDCSNESSD